MTVAKILLVDDQPLVRKGLRMLLSLEGDIVVVGEAENGLNALKAVDTLEPDIVLMDLEMPEMDGIAAANILAKRHPDVHIIILSIHSSPDIRERVLEAGASAFVEKRDGLDRLMGEIRRITGPL